jgi:hypothetical protein
MEWLVAALGIACVAIVAATLRARTVLLAAVFMASWHGLAVDVGVNIHPFHVLLTVLVGILLFDRDRPQRSAHAAASFWFIAFVAYGALRTFLEIPFLPQTSPVFAGGLREPVYRASAQIIRFLLDVSPVLIVGWVIRSSEDLTKIGRTYVISALVLAVIGWWQLAYWRATGANPLPIEFASAMLGLTGARDASFVSGDQMITRMNSLGGEPRDLAASLSVALILIQAVALERGIFKNKKMLSVWFFLFASLLATFSTQGWVMWLFGTGVQWLTSKSRLTSGIALASFTALFLIGGSLVFPDDGGGWMQILAERTVERTEFSTGEDFDQAVFRFLVDQPEYFLFGVGLGNAHLFAYDYLSADALEYAYAGTFQAKTGVLRIVSELGVVGLLLFLAWFRSEFRAISAGARSILSGDFEEEPRVLAGVLPKVAIVMLALYLARGNILAATTFVLLGSARVIATAASNPAQQPAHSARFARSIPATRGKARL